MNDKLKPNNNKRENRVFNPVAWGILFFSFWLSLRTIGEPQDLQIGFSWAFLGLSGILWLSIFVPTLRDILYHKYSVKFFLPIIFYVSIFTFALGWIGSWANVEGYLRTLTIIFGFMWILAYLFILIRITNKPLGIIVSIVFIGLAIYRFTNGLILAGIMLVIIGIVIFVVALWRPNIWHRLTFE